MLKYISKIVLFLSLYITLISCNHAVQNPTLPKKYDSIQKVWNHRKIIFPDSLQFFRLREGADSNQILKSDVKLITYINGECSLCMEELKHWKKFVKDYPKNKSLQLIIVIRSADFKYLDYMVSKEKGNYTILYDKYNRFFETNDLPFDKFYQTMLLNKENQVITVGSPIYSKYLVKPYHDKADSLINAYRR